MSGKAASNEFEGVRNVLRINVSASIKMLGLE